MRRFILRGGEQLEKTKQNLYQTLKSLDLSKPMLIEIKQYVGGKTAEQRNSFHFLCGLIADETGYTLGEVKELIKMHVFGCKAVSVGDVDVEVSMQSESLNGKQYAELIEECFRLSAVMGFQLPMLSRIQEDR